MLLVDNGEGEIAKANVLGKDRVGADENIDSPVSKAVRIADRGAPRSRPVNNASRTPAALAIPSREARCWRARISVGAMKAPW